MYVVLNILTSTQVSGAASHVPQQFWGQFPSNTLCFPPTLAKQAYPLGCTSNQTFALTAPDEPRWQEVLVDGGPRRAGEVQDIYGSFTSMLEVQARKLGDEA